MFNNSLNALENSFEEATKVKIDKEKKVNKKQEKKKKKKKKLASAVKEPSQF